MKIDAKSLGLCAAFPVQPPVDESGRTAVGYPEPDPGMTIRQRFAMAAMQAIVSSIDGEDSYQRLRHHAMAEGMTVSQWIARDSVKQAEALLVELAAGP